MEKRKMTPPACAACKMQRKKCSAECLLAPHFPSHDAHKFAIVHTVFGTSRVIKMLKGLEAEQREDAVNSMVYEATARMKDPVYGSTGTILQMQKRIADLESQLAATQAELVSTRLQREKLVSLLINGSHNDENVLDATSKGNEDTMFDPFLPWEPLWGV